MERMSKPQLIHNDTMQAPSHTPFQAYWFHNSLCDVCYKITGLHTVGGGGLNRTSELQTAAVEMESAHVNEPTGRI